MNSLILPSFFKRAKKSQDHCADYVGVRDMKKRLQIEQLCKKQSWLSSAYLFHERLPIVFWMH